MKLLILLFLFSTSVLALNPGDVAPEFSLKNQEGKLIKLSDLKGQIVVLEWFNDGCPFVRKHYDSGNMQTTQRTYKENDYVTWLTINSSAPGKQGHIKDAAAAKKVMASEKGFMDHLLLDAGGKVGQAYGAKTTPHMYIIDAKGVVQYVGAIDSVPSANQEDISGSKNYVLSALSKMLLQENPNPAKTKPYGCGVKY